ncbi:hypothetical protein MASR1M45_16170 [Candidatus Kapaibacterium sp.]
MVDMVHLLFGNYRRVKLNASIDLEGIYYSLDTVVNLFNFDDKFNIKYVLSIINSKLVTWYFHIYQKAFSQLTIHSGNENSRNIPILPLSLEAQQPFITLADTMLDKNKDLQEKNNKFQELLKADFNIEKLNTKLENWYNLSWAEFVNELKKLKVTLSGEMKEDWIERFNRYKSQITELQNIIQTTDKKIDQLVYELYGLSEEEIKVVEGE